LFVIAPGEDSGGFLFCSSFQASAAIWRGAAKSAAARNASHNSDQALHTHNGITGLTLGANELLMGSNLLITAKGRKREAVGGMRHSVSIAVKTRPSR
jgi:hypothetical protein